MRAAVPLRHPQRPARNTRSSARHAMVKSFRVSAPIALSTSASMAGLATPARLYDPLVAADCDEKYGRRLSPGVGEKFMRWVVTSKSKDWTCARYCTASMTRISASIPTRAKILDEGRVVRLERRLIDQEFDLQDLTVGQEPLAVLDRQPGILQQLLRLAQGVRSCPDPTEAGGKKGRSNTSSGTWPRNGSSSFNSSGDGAPSATMSEFWNGETVRAYAPYITFLLVHSKSKAWINASRTRGSLSWSRRVLMIQPRAPDGDSSGRISLDAAILDGREIIPRRPDARGELLAEQVVLRGKALEGNVPVPIEFVAHGVEIVAASADRQIGCPPILDPFIRRSD